MGQETHATQSVTKNLMKHPGYFAGAAAFAFSHASTADFG